MAWTRQKYRAFRAGHPAWRRCSSLKYTRYSRSSRLASRAPRAGIHGTSVVSTPLVAYPDQMYSASLAGHPDARHGSALTHLTYGRDASLSRLAARVQRVDICETPDQDRRPAPPAWNLGTRSGPQLKALFLSLVSSIWSAAAGEQAGAACRSVCPAILYSGH